MRPIRILLSATALGMLIAVGGSTIAMAHAELVGSDPAAGSRLDEAPAQVTLRFSESVSLVANGIRLLDEGGENVPAGEPVALGSTVVVPTPGLDHGGYVLVWRVVSADSHPVSGGLAFGIGEAPPEAAAGDASPTTPGVVLVVARWSGYTGMALLLGPCVLVTACWRAGRTDPVVRRLIIGGASVVAIAALAGFLAQGPYTAGRTIADAFDPSLIGRTAGSAFGMAALVRAVVTGLLALALWTFRRSFAGVVVPAAAVAGAVAAATFAPQGHAWAADPRWLGVTVSALHVVAMATWIGGLIALLSTGARSRAIPPAGDRGEGAPHLRRWSRVAATCVVVLAGTGAIAGVREVGGWAALTDSRYGILLIAKLLLVAVIVAVASRSRGLVHSVSGSASARPGRRLQAYVAAEAAVAAVVLGVTAVLVATPPAGAVRAAAGVSDPVSATLPDGSTATVSTRSGRLLRIDIRPGPGGAPPTEVAARASHAERDVRNLPIPVHADGGGWAAHDDPLPFPGAWTVTVTVRTSPLDSGVATVALNVP